MAKNSGRDYWEKRKKLGKPKYIKSPAELWRLACEYFTQADESPILKEDFLKGGEAAGTKINVKIMRPYTWEGFNAFLFSKGILTTLKDYKSNRDERYSEYVPIIRAIDDIIFDRNFSGAAAQVLSSNLISRQLGLAEKTISEIDANIKPQEVDYTKLSDETLEEIISIFDNRATKENGK